MKTIVFVSLFLIGFNAHADQMVRISDKTLADFDVNSATECERIDDSATERFTLKAKSELVVRLTSGKVLKLVHKSETSRPKWEEHRIEFLCRLQKDVANGPIRDFALELEAVRNGDISNQSNGPGVPLSCVKKAIEVFYDKDLVITQKFEKTVVVACP